MPSTHLGQVFLASERTYTCWGIRSSLSISQEAHVRYFLKHEDLKRCESETNCEGGVVRCEVGVRVRVRV